LRLLLSTILILFTIGCTSKTNNEVVILIDPEQLYDISFKDESGRATIVFNKSRGVDIMVWVKDLDPLEDYEIALVHDNGKGGVMFGPADNLDIKMGTIEGDTILHPNVKGELYVSMLNSERVFLGAEKVKIVVSIRDQGVVLESSPFRF